MSAAEGNGRTVDEAIERALRVLGAERDQVRVEVLQEPRAALLGFGGREARVRVTRRRPGVDLVGSVMTEVARMMGLMVEVRAIEEADGIVVTMEGQDLSNLIGRHGQTLDALEMLVGLHAAKQLGQRIVLSLDAGGYRAQREKSLVEEARRAADRVASRGQPVSLDPMVARDRRTVHLALRDDSRVMTASEGEEGSRRVVVTPRTVPSTSSNAYEGTPQHELQPEEPDETV